MVGFPIRKSTGHRSCAPHRSLSQLITSFVASESQGIRQLLLLTFKFLLNQYVKELSTTRGSCGDKFGIEPTSPEGVALPRAHHLNFHLRCGRRFDLRWNLGNLIIEHLTRSTFVEFENASPLS